MWSLFAIFVGSFFVSFPAYSSADLLNQLVRENRLEEALPVCRQYEVLPTRDDAVNFNCAWVYYRTFRPEAAEAVLQKSRGSATLPEYQLLKIYGTVAKELLEQKSLEKLSPEAKQDYELKIKAKILEAQKDLQGFLERYKNHPVITKAKEINGEFYEMKGQLEPAAFIYRGILADQPKSAQAHWGLGRYYLAQGDLRRAKISMEETAVFWPKHVSSRYNLALISISQRGAQKNDEAAKWLTQAFKLNQSDTGVLEQIGVLLEANGKPLVALKYWNRALELNPNSSLALKKVQQNSTLVIQDLAAKEKWEEVISKIASFSGAGGETPEDLLLYEGMAHRHLGSFMRASRILTRVLEMNPNSPIAIREFGICELNLNRTNEAITLFDKAARMEKNEGLNYAWLGFAFEAKRDYWRAAKAWTEASGLFRDPKEIKNAIEKVVRLEQKMGKRFVASEDSESEFEKESRPEPKTEPHFEKEKEKIILKPKQRKIDGASKETDDFDDFQKEKPKEKSEEKSEPAWDW
jgi:tetratricopeptide (TPR) repeat protein